MSMKIESFGGRIGWALRKTAPALASWAYTKTMFALRRKETLRYIDRFLNNGQQVPKPLLFSIETINRCNGSCSFCPCNAKDESRPLNRMTDELFHSIIGQLADWNYKGRLIMNLNNEPFMDADIIERTRYARENLPDVNMYLITNGTLMALDKFRRIAPFLDEININNYSRKMQLHENIRSVTQFVNDNPDEFSHLTIDVQYRYVDEVLSNRNGTSPNKRAPSGRAMHEPCMEPYTSMVVFPNGVVGLCCNDTREKTNFGSCQERTLAEIWSSSALNQVRELMRRDRSKYNFCQNCDAFAKVMRSKLKKNTEPQGLS